MFIRKREDGGYQILMFGCCAGFTVSWRSWAWACTTVVIGYSLALFVIPALALWRLVRRGK